MKKYLPCYVMGLLGTLTAILIIFICVHIETAWSSRVVWSVERGDIIETHSCALSSQKYFIVSTSKEFRANEGTRVIRGSYIKNANSSYLFLEKDELLYKDKPKIVGKLVGVDWIPSY
jgi:hypothetical protein